MAEKIEEEFGIIVPRLFRSMCLDTVPESENDAYSNHCTLLLEFIGNAPKEQDRDDLKKLIERHGGSSIKSCQPLSERILDFGNVTSNQKEEKCWVVEYKKPLDAEKAYKKLKSFDGVKASFPLQTLTKSINEENDNNLNIAHEDARKITLECRIGNILRSIGLFCVIASSIVFAVLALQLLQVSTICSCSVKFTISIQFKACY